MDTKELGKRYDRIAEWWNEEVSKINPGFEYVERSLNFLNKKLKILDVGCGVGRLIGNLEGVHQVTGIDISTEMIKLAKARHPSVEFINEDFYEWDTQAKFDFIIAWDSVFHAPHELQKPITVKMCDLLREGGILLFTAGGVDGQVSGTMKGVEFEYASLDYRHYLKILDEKSCKIILMERDQYPHEHMVFICQKVEG